MEALIALVIGVLTAGGVFLALRGQTFPVVLGLTLMSYAVNLFLFVMGRLAIGVPPVISDAARATPTRCRRRWCSPPSSSASA
jgi:multicomponent K+:H+ antiporter subunit C